MSTLNSLLNSLTNKVVEKTIEQIDMNDLYNQSDMQDYSFRDFYNAVKETDLKLAKQIDNWFKLNTKKQLMERLTGIQASDKKVVDLTPKPEVVHIPANPTKMNYEPDPCARGGHWGRGNGC